MSILIKHLKMPPVGESRTFVIDGNGDVHINGSLGHQRLVDYAVQLPSDDLISKDDLLELEMPDKGGVHVHSCNEAYKMGWEDLMMEISNARAVVKGETDA